MFGSFYRMQSIDVIYTQDIPRVYIHFTFMYAVFYSTTSVRLLNSFINFDISFRHYGLCLTNADSR